MNPKPEANPVFAYQDPMAELEELRHTTTAGWRQFQVLAVLTLCVALLFITHFTPGECTAFFSAFVLIRVWTAYKEERVQKMLAAMHAMNQEIKELRAAQR